MVALPAVLVLWVSAENEIFAVKEQIVVFKVVGVVRPLMAKPDTWAPSLDVVNKSNRVDKMYKCFMIRNLMT
jgi:hypothetical protein